MEIISNGARWNGQANATVEELIAVLERPDVILHPDFEIINGGFMHHIGGDQYEVLGNFVEVSHVFNIRGTLEELTPIGQAILRNVSRPEYKRVLAICAEEQRRALERWQQSKAA